MVIFQNSEDLLEYFNWNEEIIQLEKRCFTLFLEEVFKNYKTNINYRTEEIVKQQYFEAQSFKDLENEFKKNLEDEKSKWVCYLIRSATVSYWRR
jgi:hypothetical protein